MDAAANTMRAAVLGGPRGTRVERVARPEPGPGAVRVKMEGCGLCGSNLPVWEGRDWFRYPLSPGAPGHEGWGVVDALGPGVSGLKPGDRVATLSSAALAEYEVVDAASAVVLPRALDGKPFPGEPLGCAMNIFRRADIQPGQTVAILGIGFLGAVVTRLATNAGARVIAITRRPWALELARGYGAAECIPMDDHHRIVERVKDLTHGTFCDRVIEVVGEQWPLDLAGELTRERGRLIIAGYHQDGPRQVNMQLWNWRGLDVINAHERDPRVYVEGIRLAVDAVASGRLDPFPLFTHTYGMEDLDQAFHAMRTRPDGFLKALVTV
ncbi:zinc-binding dehydrogenase [Corallococcus sp. ZKHCc1 1396]|uniref:Zinc-binding dehydrogenase n=1 Tax=Corallococcus soli TaxID=2710757 RepID=A0ABR9PJL9_9BACT|nr:zinc-binding dehydrogenase [Corallococcus soli]MBE4748094.1 zinc-binding dehydrogenase [Corallococcus soli]